MPITRQSSKASVLSQKSRTSGGGKKPSGGSSRRSNVSAGSSIARKRDDIKAAATAAILDEKTNAQALRKNKAYQQLKRDMEQRMRQRAKQQQQEGERRVEVLYVDRDRAAAVSIGSKDIKSDLRHKKKRDRKENAEAVATQEEDECDRDTFLAQGQYELKNGEPKRALFYLNKASGSVPDDETLYVLRSQCHRMLGNYDAADADADRSLRNNPFSVKGLLAKADTQYHRGNFEHALKYFHRAQAERPEYNGVRLGINKSRGAIENSLTKVNGFDFMQMSDVIEELVKEKRFPCEEDESPGIGSSDNLSMAAKIKKLGYVDAHEDVFDPYGDVETIIEEEEDLTEDADTTEEMIDKVQISKGKAYDDDDMLSSIDVHKIMGVIKPSATKEAILSRMMSRIKSARAAVSVKITKDVKKCNAQELRMANKQLLGKLHYDQIYLESLLTNPMLNKKYNIPGDETVDIVQKKIVQCANEGLAFLSARKDFWQQQKPVYARKNELVATQRAKLAKKSTQQFKLDKCQKNRNNLLMDSP